MPFPDNHFDLVTCQTVLIHVADVLEALREMLRVLKPGGLLLAVEPNNTFIQIINNNLSLNDDVEDIVQQVRMSLYCERDYAHFLGVLTLKWVRAQFVLAILCKYDIIDQGFVITELGGAMKEKKQVEDIKSTSVVQGSNGAAKTIYNLTYQVEGKDVALPNEILQRILSHLPLEALFARSIGPFRQRDPSSTERVNLRLVNKAFNSAVKELLKAHSSLRHAINTSVGYTRETTQAILTHRGFVVDAEDFSMLTAKHSTELQFFMDITPGTVALVGQAYAHELDASAPFYTVNGEHTITLYPTEGLPQINYDQLAEPQQETSAESQILRLKPSAQFFGHQNAIDHNTVIRLQKDLMVSGDKGGAIFVWRPSDQPTFDKTSKLDEVQQELSKRHKKKKNGFFGIFGRNQTQNRETSEKIEAGKAVSNLSQAEGKNSDTKYLRLMREHNHSITALTAIDNIHFASGDSSGVIKLWNRDKEASIGSWQTSCGEIIGLRWTAGSIYFTNSYKESGNVMVAVNKIRDGQVTSVYQPNFTLDPNSLSHHVHLGAQRLAMLERLSDSQKLVSDNWQKDCEKNALSPSTKTEKVSTDGLCFFTQIGHVARLQTKAKAHVCKITIPLTDYELSDGTANAHIFRP